MEIFNEFSFHIQTFHYMFFEQCQSPNYAIGISYITFYFINYLVNLNVLLNQILYSSLPKICSKIRDYYDNYKYNKRK